MGKGFPQLKRSRLEYTLRRTALAGTALLAFVTATVAATTALEGHADAGVVIDSGTVVSVSTTGFAWRDGIRPGQAVVAYTRAEQGWSLVVVGAAGLLESHEAPIDAAIRGLLPFAVLGLGAGCLAVVFLRINREWSLPAACVALVCASVPLYPANHPLTGPAIVAAALVPAGWACWRARGMPLVAGAIAVLSLGLVGGWLVGYLDGTLADAVDESRRTLALGCTGLLMVDRAVQNRPVKPIRLTSLRASALVAAVTFIAVGLALVYFAAFPAPVVAIALVIGLLAVQPIRALLGRRVELALMADLRQQVAADVAEEERGRLARELHDTPLQELSAVIRRLELVPNTETETRSLLTIADQLRSLAVDLDPPMLHDLGLGAALDYLAEQESSGDTAIAIAFSDSTGLDSNNRPPAPVEVALYRISREAVNNALGHARARNVTIGGRISPDSIDLVVVDDGVGMKEDAGREAATRGRLGLASMRRRAQAIGAELEIAGTRAGTRVAVAWRK